MVNADLPFEMILLDHDGLMTPVLKAHFGPIRVEKQLDEGQNLGKLRRVSRLHQVATGLIILDADMILNIGELTPEIMGGLHGSTIPFGQLLIQSGSAAKSVDRVISRIAGQDGQADRLRRQHRLINAHTQAELCQIMETLSPLPVLMAARTAQEGGL